MLPRCRYCLAESHQSMDCQFALREEPPPPKQPRWAMGQPPTNMGRAGERMSRGVEICDLFNRPEGNRCNFWWCRYAYMCNHCRQGHTQPLSTREEWVKKGKVLPCLARAGGWSGQQPPVATKALQGDRDSSDCVYSVP